MGYGLIGRSGRVMLHATWKATERCVEKCTFIRDMGRCKSWSCPAEKQYTCAIRKLTKRGHSSMTSGHKVQISDYSPWKNFDTFAIDVELRTYLIWGLREFAEHVSRWITWSITNGYPGGRCLKECLSKALLQREKKLSIGRNGWSKITVLV